MELPFVNVCFYYSKEFYHRCCSVKPVICLMGKDLPLLSSIFKGVSHGFAFTFDVLW